ncbi:MAG: hydrogenase maturation protease, partial [Chloroflexi bacterium]|nr:hydrogenase maturation protease [Chloroflexota bacterium]
MKTLVLGLGNSVLCDDAAGIRVARALVSRVDQPEVTVAEACAAGLDILDLLAGYDEAIIIDAVQTDDGEPGQIHRFNPGAFDAARRLKSAHDIDLVTALEFGNRLGMSLPQEITIFGIEAEDVYT